jgi:hypothetical protein
MSPTRLVLVLENDARLMDDVEGSIRDRGYEVVAAQITSIEGDGRFLADLLRILDPTIVLWDVSDPDERSWKALDDACRMDVLRGRWVVVTRRTNRSGTHLLGQDLARRPGVDELLLGLQSAIALCERRLDVAPLTVR